MTKLPVLRLLWLLPLTALALVLGASSLGLVYHSLFYSFSWEALGWAALNSLSCVAAWLAWRNTLKGRAKARPSEEGTK
jgi:hypothetical protein